MTWLSLIGIILTVGLFLIPARIAPRFARRQTMPWPPPLVLTVRTGWPPPVLS